MRRFEEAYGGWREKRLTQAEAATRQSLGVCERIFRRHICRHEEEGLAGLPDRRLERVSLRPVGCRSLTRVSVVEAR